MFTPQVPKVPTLDGLRRAGPAAQNDLVLSSATLRSLGPAGLADLLRLRPEVLDPSPPGSLQELSARLRHPTLVHHALQRLDLPTLQVAEALAALGDRADRKRLLGLLGVDQDDDRRAAVERALGTLRAHALLQSDTGCRLLPEARDLWLAPLALGPDLETLAVVRPADHLRAVLHALGEPLPTRKAELISRVVTVLGDPDRVRRLLHDAPPGLAEQLIEVAHGRRVLDDVGWHTIRRTRVDARQQTPLEWALGRFLLVRADWGTELSMPAEVALALRGPKWVAPFDPDPPPVEWTARSQSSVARAAAAAASAVLSTITAVLTAAGARPIPRLKSGAVGVRELRRLCGSVGCAVAETRLVLALADAMELLSVDDAGFVPTRRFDTWRLLSAAERYADVVTAWLALPASPFAEPDAAWAPEGKPSRRIVRRTVLAVLAGCPDGAPASVDALIARTRWLAPLLMVGIVSAAAAPSGGFGADVNAVGSVLGEAAWLGVTGAEALSPAGAAALAGNDVAAAVGAALGTAQTRARLQADLTAVVLGEPGPQLAATLDRMADRENRSAATVWRFSPASVRRAMDAGADDAGLLAQLTEVAEGGVPQPLEYLVHDVARRHGVLRGGTVACYLRSDDEALLAELVADRKLRSLGLRRVAPTVVVGRRPLAETLDALRTAGHSPVEEAPDGATVVTRDRDHRVEAPPRRRPHPVAAVTMAEVAETLLAGRNDAAGQLVDVGTTVIDIVLHSRSGAALEPLW
jgi:hypothetical protein